MTALTILGSTGSIGTSTLDVVRRNRHLYEVYALVMDAVRKHGAELLPVDSEHNGAHQCLRAGNRGQVSKLILTASGGPFRNTPREQLAHVTPEQALKHPTWQMGNRITIDSATLMNKGFEVSDACVLVDFKPSRVDVGI